MKPLLVDFLEEVKTGSVYVICFLVVLTAPFVTLVVWFLYKAMCSS